MGRGKWSATLPHAYTRGCASVRVRMVVGEVGRLAEPITTGALPSNLIFARLDGWPWLA